VTELFFHLLFAFSKVDKTVRASKSIKIDLSLPVYTRPIPMRTKRFGGGRPPPPSGLRGRHGRGRVRMLFLVCIALWLAFDTWRWGVLGGRRGEQQKNEEDWERELAELEALSRSAINARAGGGEGGDDWFESWRTRGGGGGDPSSTSSSSSTTPPTWTATMMERWWLTNRKSSTGGGAAADDRSGEPLLVEPDDVNDDEASPPALTGAERMAALRARVERAREREKALFEKIKFARKARLEELRLERYHQSPEYKRWLKNREEKKEETKREKEAVKRAGPFQHAQWRMHDGKFHDLEDTAVVRSTRLVVAAAAGAGAGSEPDAEGGAEREREREEDDAEEAAAAVNGGGGGGGVNRVKGASQGRQRDSYLRRGGAAQGWVSAPPTDLFDSTDDEDPPEHLQDGTSASASAASTNSNAKRWAALMKPKRPSRKGGEDAQTMEARLVYGDGADVRGGGLDIEGIEEDGATQPHGHGVNHGGARKGSDGGGDAAAKQRIAAVSGGSSKDMRLGGDRWGVGVMGRNKGAQRGTTTGASSSSSMIRGHGGGDVVQVGSSFKTNGGHNKLLYQGGFGFANLPQGRSV
jgi:hypothetical protein